VNAKTAPPRVRLEKPKPERISHFTTTVDEDAMEFIQAIEVFKKAKHRPFPTWGEVLQVLKGLGYRKHHG
jgi:hypothetical protein